MLSHNQVTSDVVALILVRNHVTQPQFLNVCSNFIFSEGISSVSTLDMSFEYSSNKEENSREWSKNYAG